MYGEVCVGVSGEVRELDKVIKEIVKDCFRNVEEYGIERGEDIFIEDYEILSLF